MLLPVKKDKTYSAVFLCPADYHSQPGHLQTWLWQCTTSWSPKNCHEQTATGPAHGCTCGGRPEEERSHYWHYVQTSLVTSHRSYFKVHLLTFKALNNLAPEYISELLTIYTPSRSLRSTNQPTRLLVPHTNRVTYSRCFYAIAPTVWNNLPDNLKKCTSVAMFKCMLKTYLFRRSSHWLVMWCFNFKTIFSLVTVYIIL